MAAQTRISRQGGILSGTPTSGVQGGWSFGARALLAVILSSGLLQTPVEALVITEVMYHPDGVNNTTHEYIEFYNENPDPFDLGGFRVCNGVAYEFPNPTILESGEFIVLVGDKAQFDSTYGAGLNSVQWTAGSLDNGGERIELCNPGNAVVISFRYNDRDGWPAGADGTGHSIELQSPYLSEEDDDSWVLSNDMGGSPGRVNPCWMGVSGGGGPSGGGPVGEFSEHVDVGFPCGTGDVSFSSNRYTIEGGGNDIWAGGDQFHFSYVKINGNFNIQARVVSHAWADSRWGKSGLMARQDLSGSSHYVFVHDNPTEDGARMAHRPTHGGNDNAEPFTLGDNPRWYRLQRSGGTITGYWSDNGTNWTPFGSVNWRGGTQAHVGLALTSHHDCATARTIWDNLQITGDIEPPDGPEPPDPPPEPGECTARVPVVFNEGYFRGGGDRWVELYNPGDTTVDLTDYYITDDPSDLTKEQLPIGTSLIAGGFRALTDVELGLDFSVSVAGDRVFVALVEPSGQRVVTAANFEPSFEPGAENFSDARLPDGADSFSFGADPTEAAANSISSSTDIVINEIMYNSITDSPDREYAELYNKSLSPVNISGWRFTRGINFEFPPGTIVPAQGYLVVARNPDEIRAIYGLSASEVIGPEQTPEALAAYGGLNNRGERVRLRDEFNRTVDTFSYRDGGEWTRWPDGLGSSLELIDAEQDNRFGQAWDASDDSDKALTQEFSYLGRHGGGESELSMFLNDRGMAVVDDVSVSSGFTVEETPLISSGETWRYFKGTSQPPNNWNELAFNDGTWLSGATGIGYGDGDDTTVLGDMQGAYTTVYCRKTFNVADRTAIDDLILTVSVDDGFRAYLNGQQVAAYNPGGTDFQSVSSGTVGDFDNVETDISAFKNLLVNGTNVLAVIVYNATADSSDLSFNPELLSRLTTVGGPGTEFLTNGTFNSNTSGWIIAGSHVRSGRTTQNAINGSGSLKMIASQRGNNKAGRIETANGTLNSLPTNTDVLVSFKARWVVGAEVMVTRGYRHSMAKSHNLVVPDDLGTPGRINSVTARRIADAGSSNLGPVVRNVSQDPPVPGGGDDVTIRCEVHDPNGVNFARIRYSINNPTSVPSTATMSHVGGGIYEGVIPGQSSGQIVVFYIETEDSTGQDGRYPVDIRERSHPLLINPPSSSLHDRRYLMYRHDVELPGTSFHSYRFVMTEFDEAELSNRPRLSNDLLDGSFVFGGQRIYHESHTRFSGSPWARGQWGGSFRVQLPRDEPLHGKIRRFNLDNRHGPGTDARERMSHYILRQHNRGGLSIPYSGEFTLARWQVNERVPGNREHVEVPNGDFNRLWFPEDSDGTFLEMDDHFIIDDGGQGRQDSRDGRVHYPPSGYPGVVFGGGEDKEAYRWYFNLRGSRAGKDDYSVFQNFARIVDPSSTPSNAQFAEQIWDVCNVEDFLRVWSVRMNTGDWDTWGTDRGKNAYFFAPELDGRFHLYMWDAELTYEGGRLDSFQIPTNPSSDFNPGSFNEVNRFFDVPKIKRMYYAILDEMVNGPTAFFTSAHLGTYASALATAGMTNTSIATSGGFVDQRRDRLRSRISGAVYPSVRLRISTNGGNNFTTNEPFVDLQGTAPAEACSILVDGEMYPLRFTSMTGWVLEDIFLLPGPNDLMLVGLDLLGNPIDTDSIVVTSTAGPLEPPSITSINPSSTFVGDGVEIDGTDFLDGVQVFFGAVEATDVTFDRNGPNPTTIFATVPPGSGTVQVSVENVDAQTSNSVNFTYIDPPPMFRRADANDDAVIDISDAFKVFRVIVGDTTTDCEDALDVNDDETLNATDAVYLLNYLYLNGPIVPPPFTAVGADPTGSALDCER